MISGMLHRVLWQKLADVSEMLTAAIIKTISKRWKAFSYVQIILQTSLDSSLILTGFVWVWNLVSHIKGRTWIYVWERSRLLSVFGPKREEVKGGWRNWRECLKLEAHAHSI
jgi:hypothetical protein